ncbi:MAG: hypothetical protein ACOY3P_08000 [Planctomycetota bacterium]
MITLHNRSRLPHHAAPAHSAASKSADDVSRASLLLSPRAQAHWLGALLAIGIAARLLRYLLCFPLWEDEAMLSANYLDRGYLGLLEPLNYCQVAPPLFLWCQLSVVRLLGFNEYALRLVPFLCSLGSMGLFYDLGRRLLRDMRAAPGAGAMPELASGMPFQYRCVQARTLQGCDTVDPHPDDRMKSFASAALLISVGVFALGYPGIRYAAEAKPYGCDLFLSLLCAWLLLRWWDRPAQSRWLWLLAALVGSAIGFSFPMIFVAGTISAIVGYGLLRACRIEKKESAVVGPAHVGTPSVTGERRGDHWCTFRVSTIAAWLAINAAILLAFGMLMHITRAASGDAVQARMASEHWGHTFPPLQNPIQFVGWLVSTHAGGLLAYPIGADRGGSTLSLLAAVAGSVLLWRKRQWRWLALCLLPLVLNLAAAAMHKYPYGGHVRMGLYQGWAFCLLIGLGAAAAILRVRHPRPLVIGALVGLTFLGIASVARDVTHPFKSVTTLRAREFARWFWPSLGHNGELVCLETDWRADLSPGTYNWGWSALYLCNQRIYSPRHAAGLPPQLEAVSAEHPLRCVLYRSSTEERPNGGLERWLAEMQESYTFVSREQYPFLVHDKRGRELRGVDTIEVFKFVPKMAAPAVAARKSEGR